MDTKNKTRETKEFCIIRKFMYFWKVWILTSRPEFEQHKKMKLEMGSLWIASSDLS